ncbi:lymphocyte activation gene 3 protein [Spea bombifrons]|uniref:lymphocyte activation gene 3 protein n=1 Tax=Spea bombifrons TaxID=233779 RepID=UPI00234AF6F6|nr:lymphocyte activation gene 3 protein [Spea bombifrons]
MHLNLFYILCLPALCAGSVMEVTGVTGNGVILPCHMNTTQLDTVRRSKYPATSVHWHRDRRTVVVARPSGVTYTAQLLATRASLRKPLFGLGDFSLHLKRVGERDAGVYECQAQYGDVKQTCTVTLAVIQVTQSPRGLIPQHGSAKLTCSRAGPKLSADPLRWFHRGVPVYSNAKYLIQGDELHLKDIGVDDEGDWSCQENGVKATRTLKVLAISGPPSLSVYTAVGSRAELPCTVTHTPTEWPLIVRWQKSTDQNKLDANGQTYVLYHVSPGDAGKYRCDVTYGNHRMSRDIDLKVIQVLPSGPGFVTEGSRLRLECNVLGSDGGERYEWTGPSTRIEGREVKRGSVLDLPVVRTEDAGLWNCSVYGENIIVGKVEYTLYVQAAYAGGFGELSSWQTYVILLLSLLLVSGLAAVAAVSVRNRRRRLSHLTALMPPVPSTPARKSLSV